MDYSHSDILMAHCLSDFTKHTGLRLVDCDVNMYSSFYKRPLFGIDLRFDVLNEERLYFNCSPGDLKEIYDMLLMAIHIQHLIGAEKLEESELITKLVQENFELRKRLGEAGDDLTLED